MCALSNQVAASGRGRDSPIPPFSPKTRYSSFFIQGSITPWHSSLSYFTTISTLLSVPFPFTLHPHRHTIPWYLISKSLSAITPVKGHRPAPLHSLFGSCPHNPGSIAHIAPFFMSLQFFLQNPKANVSLNDSHRNLTFSLPSHTSSLPSFLNSHDTYDIYAIHSLLAAIFDHRRLPLYFQWQLHVDTHNIKFYGADWDKIYIIFHGS